MGSGIPSGLFPAVEEAQRSGHISGRAARSECPQYYNNASPIWSVFGRSRFAEGKATKLSSAWTGRHEEVFKVLFLRTVVVILGPRGRTPGQKPGPGTRARNPDRNHWERSA